MTLSVFDLFKVGIGPSSSHTVGPMVAAYRFSATANALPAANPVRRVQAELFGSLALTGWGHATDVAILLGLVGHRPESVDPDQVPTLISDIRSTGSLTLAGCSRIPFVEKSDLLFHKDRSLPRHPNGMRFLAIDGNNEVLLEEIYYSVGGGFVLREDEFDNGGQNSDTTLPLEFHSAKQLLAIGHREHKTIAEIMWVNERSLRSDQDIRDGLLRIWNVMESCIERGCRTGGVLPGGLNVRRRAPAIHANLTKVAAAKDGFTTMDWVSLFALAVNEENAAGGRVVTAPTNGAAGVIPAVLAYYHRFMPNANKDGIITFLLTAAAIGMLYKRNASLSAAEMGCQGEVGVACSMAAAGLAAVMGGTNEQIENAAEIGMEHNLGLTCDPIAGLVQVPCIERNTMGANKAINAARLAVLHGDGQHRVPLDRVIETMRQTGVDMQSKYKETSLGGLAVNMVDC